MSFYEELVKSIPIWQEAEYDLCKQRIKGAFKHTPYASYVYISEQHEHIRNKLLAEGFKVSTVIDCHPTKWKIEL